MRVTTGDTRRFGYAVGTFASRAAVMSGSAVALAARAVRAKALRVAVGRAGVLAATTWRSIDGVVSVKGNPTASHPAGPGGRAVQPAAVRLRRGRARRPPSSPGRPIRTSRRWPRTTSRGWRRRDYYSPPRSTFASGMHAAIVEIDPDTSEITIERYCVVHDCGTLINPMIVAGQVHGGVAQGIGGALYERWPTTSTGSC